jgi:hypothetical protein
LSDIAQCGRAQQRVGNGVQEHVSVAEPDQFPVVGNIYPAQAERSARPQAMRIVSDSNSHSSRGKSSCKSKL